MPEARTPKESTLPRTLIIGLDGATWDLLDPWIEAGHLPTLQRMVSEGVRGPLRAWPNMNSAASWTSIVTGCNPGRHGIFGFFDAGTGGANGLHLTHATDRRREPFWNVLASAGETVGVINVPLTYPVDEGPSFMIAGMDAPSVETEGAVHPSSLLEELAEFGIDYRLDVPNLAEAYQRDSRSIPESVCRTLDSRLAAVRYLMSTRAWDTMMVVVTVTDRMQHHFWPEPGSDGGPLLELYQRIDQGISELMNEAGPETNVLIVSDHGFGPARTLGAVLNDVFESRGMLQRRVSGPSLGSLAKLGLTFGRRLIPKPVQDRLVAALPGLHSKAKTEEAYPGIDLARTAVFANGPGHEVFINPDADDRGRSHGEIQSEVRRLLESLRTTDGEPLLIRVADRGELYDGPHVSRAPSLTLEWIEREHPITVVADDPSAPVKATEPPPSNGLRGSHRPTGIIIAAGPGIRHGGEVDGACVYDLTPTILRLRSVAPPDGLDGRVLTEALDVDWLKENPVHRVSPGSQDGERRKIAVGDEGERAIEARLRGLGYLD